MTTPNNGNRLTNGQQSSSEDNDILITFHTTLSVEQREAGNLTLPRSVFADLSEPEQATLPSLLQRFFTSTAFRNTMTYDLKTPKQAPASHCSRTVNHDLVTSSSPLSSICEDHFGFDIDDLLRNYRSVIRFPFMELPVELRVMIAEYALYTPQGLFWTWKNYRKGPKVATLRHGELYSSHHLGSLGALVRTCKILYSEMHSIVFKVNHLVLDSRQMHIDREPRNWFDRRLEFSGALDIVIEALAFLQCKAPHILALFATIDFNLEKLPRHDADMSKFRDLYKTFPSFQFRIGCYSWALRPLEQYELQDIRELEEDNEPFVSEHDQMRNRLEHHFERAREVSEFVAAVSEEDRNWRVYPMPLKVRSMEKMSAFLTEQEMQLVLEWERLGI